MEKINIDVQVRVWDSVMHELYVIMFKDLILIILGAGISSAYFYWQSYKDKKEIKKQERLNAIRKF